MTTKERDIEDINREYLEKHPKAKSLLNAFETYGKDKLIEIYEESKGREIVFKVEKGLDNMSYYFKD